MNPGTLQSWKFQRTWLAVILAVALSFMTFAYSATASGPAPDAETAKFETDFMQMMIDHHNMAVEMSKMCLQKSTHDELRVMCQSMIDAQTKEIQEMQSWLSSWYQIDKQPMMMQDSEQMMSHLNSASGDEFDKMFLQMMIEHHSTAIQEATPCVQRVSHTELKNLCQNIISSQQQEIQQMQTWLTQWYQVSVNASTALPQTGGAFPVNPLLILFGAILLFTGLTLLKAKRKRSD